MTVRREAIPRQHQLRRFKGELSVLFISILFILLSAHLPLATIAAVGWSGVMTVLLLMWVVRPLNVLISTWGTDLTWRERLFTMWICPRGVVAISISSFIVILLESGSDELVGARLGPEDGQALMALVFLTIAITVVVQGLTAEPIARLLGVSAKSSRYVVVVGANALGSTLAGVLRDHGWEPLLLDANPANIGRARRLGLPAMVGNVLDRSALDEAKLEDAGVVVAVTANQEVNFLACQLALNEYHVPEVHPVLIDRDRGPRGPLVDEIGGNVAFAEETDVTRWNHDLADRRASVQSAAIQSAGSGCSISQLGDSDILPLVVVRDGEALVCHVELRCGVGDTVFALVRAGAEDRFRARLESETPSLSESRA
jgi:voltage-gated potassium channel Kch